MWVGSAVFICDEPLPDEKKSRSFQVGQWSSGDEGSLPRSAANCLSFWRKSFKICE